ncbi:hypothetical protein PFISCL1PPCAC_20274 [Pristionchus fissidentatus]|uniref:Secreted protein n=1 Tax=Pristionchus fissidentatus TaxID=1538716 RepID=A0AAV5WGA7_9BILA|nr:hypothetical protein PFISCL1PPCAC_20274 [Pristionchus fissidentatus]
MHSHSTLTSSLLPTILMSFLSFRGRNFMSDDRFWLSIFPSSKLSSTVASKNRINQISLYRMSILRTSTIFSK